MARSTVNRPGTRKRDAWLVFAFLIVIQLACFRGSTRLKATTALDRASGGYQRDGSSSNTAKAIWKRSLAQNLDDDLQGETWRDSEPTELKDPPHRTSTHHKDHSGTSASAHASSGSATSTAHRNKAAPTGESTATLPASSTTARSRSKDASTAKAPATTSSSSSKPTKAPKHDDPPEASCHPIPVSLPASEICAHVIEHCEPSGHLDYLRFYYCIGVADVDQDHHHHGPGPTPPHRPGRWQPGLAALRAVSLAIILSWMLFLFSWVGVVASDFFCPNLSTIASRLGLNESTAGVTFLAFGNGSPDVFSTFGAMKTGSGSLAIGELLGAASFIVSVISGSMMLIAPFRVKAWPFCRDVGFFTVAVALILSFLFDGKLRVSECITLICLYVAYAATVIVGGWWQERRRQKRMLLAAARDEYSTASSVGDAASLSGRTSIRSFGRTDVERNQLLSVPTGEGSPRGGLSPSEYEPEFDPFESWAAGRDRETSGDGYITPERGDRAEAVAPGLQTPGSAMSRSGSRGLVSNRPGLVPRHSLLSAIEFRDVVHSLKQDASADRSMEIFQSWDPERFLSHRHLHTHHRGSSMDRDRSPSNSPSARHGHARVTSLGPLGSAQDPTYRARRNTLGSHDQGPPSASSEASGGADGTGPTDIPRKPSVGVAAAPLAYSDPWREHVPGDGCEPLDPAAAPVNGLERDEMAPLGPNDLRKSLPRLAIPEWQTGFAQKKRQEAHDAAGDKIARRIPSVPSIKVTADEGRNSKPLTQRGLAGKPRIRRRRNRLETIVWRLSVAFYALFPSLRHIHAKSWSGIVISLVTAPAIMTLNLTLPVVDDEAGREENSDLGRDGGLRLEGNEADLLARSHSGPYRDEDEEAEEERIIHLRAHSPAGSGSFLSAEERVESAERTIRAERAQRDRDIASALRQLPETALSPFPVGSVGTETQDAGPAGGKFPFPGSPDPAYPTSQGRVHMADGLAAGGGDTGLCVPCEEEEADEVELRRSMNRFLALSQCIFAPGFVVWAIVSSAEGSHMWLKVLAAALLGTAVCTLALVMIRRKDAGKVRYSDRTVAVVGMLRCSMGFLVSVMWIMTIVDEVVSILQTIALIVGISDAILGLTVFAIGNSLGDLVANVTIARLGHPVMAISACFAGPLLNLLLGIGISGTWLLSGESSKQPWAHSELDGIYPIDFSPTLLVSGLGLLLILVGTLIAVPMNGFYLTRPLGLALIATYACIMTLNVLTEIFWVRPQSHTS